jgi:hypothetical protein
MSNVKGRYPHSFKPLHVHYDELLDTLTVNGIGYDGDAFRGSKGGLGSILKVVPGRRDGTLYFEEVKEKI